MQVSVIMVTYNSDWSGIKKTLDSVLCQKGVEFEVIVADDASQYNYKQEIENYLSRQSVPCKFFWHSENVGTIKNLIDGLELASGEYTYTTSPGDFCYDEYTLRDFYKFAKANNKKMVFGNVITYSYDPVTDKLNVYRGSVSYPFFPHIFDEGVDLGKKWRYMALGNPIFGSGFFRERNTVMDLFKEITVFAKYKEDYASTLNALLNGIDVIYYDRNIAYYEYGNGVSTDAESPFMAILIKEDEAFWKYRKEREPQSRYWAFNISYGNLIKQGPIKKFFGCFIKYPVITFKKFYYARLKRGRRRIECSDAEEAALLRLVRSDTTVTE